MKIVQQTFWQSFLDGVGSLIDLFPRPIQLPNKTDAEAFRSDWEAVGQDLADAIKAVLDESIKAVLDESKPVEEE